MTKRISAAVLAVCLFFALAVPASATSAGITIDGAPVQFTQNSGSPFIDENDRTLVPLRVTMEAYGCEVLWDNENRCGVVYKDGVTVVCPIGENRIIVNGSSVSIDTAAVISDSRTYLPIRAVLEAMGASVSWDSETFTGVITRGQTDPLLHQESYIARANAAIDANPNLGSATAQSVKIATEMYLQNIAADEAQISKMCTRLSNLVIQDSSVNGGVGSCETYDNTNYTITLDTASISRPDSASSISEVLFHELCHMFANIPDTDVWFQEGMTSLFTLSIAGSGTWEYYSYDAYLRIITALTELVGKDTMTSAYLTGSENTVTSLINSWAGVSNSATVINDCAEDMTDALIEGLFTWMDGYNPRHKAAAQAKYNAAATKLTELLNKAWQGKHGSSAYADPLMSAYLDLISRFALVTEGRKIIDPSFAAGTIYNYYGRADYKSFFVLEDKSGSFCEDGELIYYRYAA